MRPIDVNVNSFETLLNLEMSDLYSQAEKANLEAEIDRLKKSMLSNDPLTMEQLREMDGAPVWVKVSENWKKSGIKDGWRLVRLHKSDDRIRIYTYDPHFGATFVAEQDYGQSWIAYRCKPEEVES